MKAWHNLCSANEVSGAGLCRPRRPGRRVFILCGSRIKGIWPKLSMWMAKVNDPCTLQVTRISRGTGSTKL